MATDYEVRKAANEESRTRAEHYREPWEDFEVELLEEGWQDDEATLPEIAELLGRTIEACRQKHYDLGHQRAAVVRVKQRNASGNAQWDRGWTSLEDMGY
jgi:hypothetical protein